MGTHFYWIFEFSFKFECSRKMFLYLCFSFFKIWSSDFHLLIKLFKTKGDCFSITWVPFISKPSIMTSIGRSSIYLCFSAISPKVFTFYFVKWYVELHTLLKFEQLFLKFCLVYAMYCVWIWVYIFIHVCPTKKFFTDMSVLSFRESTIYCQDSST